MSQIAVAGRATLIASRGTHRRVPAPPAPAFFCPVVTQHVRSLPILSDLLTLAATLLAIGAWSLCLSLWAS